MRDIHKDYFNWLCELIDYRGRASNYTQALSYLHSREFTYFVPGDGNRYEDGLDLRYRYANERGLIFAEVCKEFDASACSVLEMMVALACRCEDHIMFDGSKGNRQSKWFWDMFRNLGLHNLSDRRFDENDICEIVDRFLNREYGSDGKGGLFVTSDPTKDMRKEEIWYQMMFNDDWK